MTHINEDIDIVLEDLERADVAAADAALDVIIREDTLRGFIARRAEQIAALLNELKLFREQSDGSDLPIKTHRVIVEGYSDESTEKALASALDKSAKYFSEYQDVNLTLKQLVELPEGGHRATIEVHLTPFTNRLKPHVTNMELELKHQQQNTFDKFRLNEAEYKKHLVFDHFAAINGGIAAGMIPEYLLIQVKDATLMNYMLEKQFFRAGQKKLQPDDPAPTAFAVKFSPELKKTE